jgi:hypothetical protein
MSLASIATNLYTIQSRKNVPLKTAFSMMVREDMAMRFSVYNLVRIITKSEFLATVAQTAYGKRTPMQKAQDEEDRKREMNDQKFKVYTQVTFARINNRLNLLTSIAERNSQLIMNLYSELGYFRGQRKMSFNSSAGFATRVMLPSKTVKTKIEEIEKQLYELSNVKKTRVRPRGAAAKKKTGAGAQTNQDSGSIANFILANPGLAMAIAAPALGIGTAALAGYAAYNLPTTLGRSIDRFKGETPTYYNDKGEAITDPQIIQNAETLAQTTDPLLLSGGVAATTAIGIKAGSMISSTAGKIKQGAISRDINNRIAQRTGQTPLDAANSRRLYRAYQQNKDLNAPGLQQTAAERDKAVKARAERIYNREVVSEWSKLLPILRGLTKVVAVGKAADITYTLSTMSTFVAERTSGKISDSKFKEKMISGYSKLITSVGIAPIAAGLGALAGTSMFPGLGTLTGGVLGGIGGTLIELYLENIADNDNLINQGITSTATALFKLLHENASVSQYMPTAMTIKSEDTNVISNLGGAVGDLSYYTGGRGQSGAATGGIEAILATIRTKESGNNYQADVMKNADAQARAKALGYGKASASGAYQFVDSSWQGLTKKYGIGTQYKRAVDAPPDVQDRVAAAYVNEILVATGGDVSKVPVAWYTGNIEGKIDARALAMNPGLSVAKYQESWLSQYAKMGNSTAGDIRRNVATADTVRTSPPPLTVSTTNAPVATIPSAEDKPKVEQNVEAAIEAKVALGQVNIVQNQMVAAVGALNQKIVDVTKKTTTEFPFTSNPEAAISSYRA